MLITHKIVFFGSGTFALPALEKLTSSGFQPHVVVTTPDALVGRKHILTPSPVKKKANARGLEVFDPKTLKNDGVLTRIRGYGAEVGVLAAYGKILPKAFIDTFPRGILNIHPSLLPRWRGPTPVESAILAGDKKTGVTVILIDEEVDHGPILANSELQIANGETSSSLHDKLAKLGAELLLETLPKWLSGEITPLPQDHTEATFSRKFTREDGKIDWQKLAAEIDRQVRALNPEPGTWTTFGSPTKTLKILAIQLFSNSRELENKKQGEIFVYKGQPAVRCGQDVLVLKVVQPEGKKPMSGEEFLRGHQESIGSILSSHRM